jgi:hypothetical protein
MMEVYNNCKCGNKKLKTSQRCRECFKSGKLRQLSRSMKKQNKKVI